MRVMGIEPISSAWKADILPLNDTRVSEAYKPDSVNRRLSLRHSTVKRVSCETCDVRLIDLTQRKEHIKNRTSVLSI